MIFYLLDKNEKIIRMLPTNRCDFAVQELNLNGIYILNFDIDIKDLWIMEDIEYIIHKDIENKENFYMYKIISDGNNKDRLEFKAIYIAMNELESYSYITDKKPKNVKVSQAVNIVITNTRWDLGEIDDSVVKSLNFYYCSPLKAITKIIDTYNVEINFRLKAEKNRIVKRLIDVKKQVGKFTGKRFFYGSNALEVIKETNNGSIYTKFIPRGKGEEVGEGFGRRIDIKDIVWSKDKGDPIDKPKGQEYIEFEDMTALYGHSDGTPRSTIVPFENIEDPNELIEAAYNYGLVNCRPQVAYKSDVERVGRINLGDGVLIIRKDLNIRYVARVYKIIKDLKNPNKTKVELGDNKDISQSKKNMDFQKKLENLDEKLNVTNINFVKKIQDGLTETMYNQESYRYEAIPGDDSGLLSGTWYFNRPIDKNPDKALYLGGGHIAMANKEDSNSNWEFTTIANGDGVIANTIVAGILKGGNVRWNLEDGTFIIGKNADDYSMYWDGGTLHFRNVDIDLKNSKDFSEIKDDLDKKISKDNILEDKEIQEALKGKDGGEFQWNLLLKGDKEIIDSTEYNFAKYELAEDIPEGSVVTLVLNMKGKRKPNTVSPYNTGGSLRALKNINLPSESGNEYRTYYVTDTWRGNKAGNKTLYLYYSIFNRPSYEPVSIKWAKLVYGSNPTLNYVPAQIEIHGKDGMPGPKGVDGKTSYMHFAYANLKSNKFFNKIDENTKFIRYKNADLTVTKKSGYFNLKSSNKNEPGLRFYHQFEPPTDKILYVYIHIKNNAKFDLMISLNSGLFEGYGQKIKVKPKETINGLYKMTYNGGSNQFRWEVDRNSVENEIDCDVYDVIFYDKIIDFDFTTNYMGQEYIGFYTDLNIKDSENPIDYKWSLFKGADGKDGIDGKDGKTGKIGQNLLRNSNVPVSNKDYPTNTWTLCETPTTGETMTFTAKVKLEKDDKLILFNSGGMISLDWWTEVSKSQDYVIYSSTFNWKDKTTSSSGKIYEQTDPPTLKLYTQSNGNGENLNNNTVSLEWATLTRGDIPAIEWSPCYADVDDAIKAGKEESEEISRKLIKVESDFKVESNNIKASVSSLSETTERSFVNLKKDMADADVKVETGIKNYLINNYSTKTQTDEKISQEVGSIKTSLGKDISNLEKEIVQTKSKIEQTDAKISSQVTLYEVSKLINDETSDFNRRITETESKITQTDKKIEAKVSKDGFSSLVKQEFDRYKVQAKNIDFEGSYVNVKGTFQTLNDEDDVGIKIDYNKIAFRDNRWDGKTFGGLKITKNSSGDKVMAVNLFHYQTGYTGIMYWNNEKKVYYNYMSFDRWNYTGFSGKNGAPIIFHENATCLNNSLRFGDWELVASGSDLKIKPCDTKSGYIFSKSGFYRYYAAGGKDVKTKLD